MTSSLELSVFFVKYNFCFKSEISISTIQDEAVTVSVKPNIKSI